MKDINALALSLPKQSENAAKGAGGEKLVGKEENRTYDDNCFGKDELVGVQAMGHLVRLVVGDWQRLAQGTWKFDINHVEVKYDVVVKENETYDALVEMVREKFCILPLEPVSLTYDFPDWMKIPGDYTTPPVDIVEDGDVELLMAVRMDFVNLAMCVAHGNEAVGRYRMVRREEFGLTEDGIEVVPPKPIPWRCMM
ncbi:hypothetical protein F2Q68_00031837 [Brassica cretica]|uniref:Uncharacterized protein n=1 Tax=Brassica cretica TaxID=69181 RepID=A0A8S9GE26_BRACR|nr:hypothetical protein F2Q68_00031837 [Brassica cretica]